MHITQSVVIQRQKVTLQKHAAGTKGHLVLLIIDGYFHDDTL